MCLHYQYIMVITHLQLLCEVVVPHVISIVCDSGQQARCRNKAIRNWMAKPQAASGINILICSLVSHGNAICQ